VYGYGLTYADSVPGRREKIKVNKLNVTKKEILKGKK
jgi:hypothetical protein